MLAKCNEWTEIEMFAHKKEEWLKKILELPNGIPSHDTIQRVISLLNPQTLYADTINYLITKINKISVKGKVQPTEYTYNKHKAVAIKQIISVEIKVER